jgi:hypothetical protein
MLHCSISLNCHLVAYIVNKKIEKQSYFYMYQFFTEPAPTTAEDSFMQSSIAIIVRKGFFERVQKKLEALDPRMQTSFWQS